MRDTIQAFEDAQRKDKAYTPLITWKLENIQNKPNSREGRTAKLCCYDGGTLLGWCYVESWLYGCALMGLSQLSNLNHIPVEEFPNFRKFLKNLSVTMGMESCYNMYTAGRYMFTTADTCFGFSQKLIQESELVKSFENLAHPSSMNKLHFFNVKTTVKE